MSATAMSVSTLRDIVLKQHYIDEGELYLADDVQNNFWDMVPKDPTGDPGQDWNEIVVDSMGAGGSNDFDRTDNNSAPPTSVRYSGPYKEMYDIKYVADKAMRLARRKGPGAFVGADELAINSAKNHFLERCEFQALRSEGGSCGRLASGSINGVQAVSMTNGVGSFVFNTNSRDAALQRIKIGDVLQFSPGPVGTDGGNGGYLRAGSWTVTALQDNGTVLATPTAATMPTGSDYCYVDGEARSTTTTQLSGSSLVRHLAGVESWIPTNATDRLSTFKNVDRSVNTTGRAGVLLPATTNAELNTAFVAAGAAAMRKSTGMTHIVVNATRFGETALELMDKQRYNLDAGTVRQLALPKGARLGKGVSSADKFSFSTLALRLPAGGEALIVPSWACQYNVSWGLNMKHWRFLHTAEGFPFNKDVTDGLTWFRTDSGNNWKFTLLGYGELICRNPGKQIAIVHSDSIL